MDTLNRGKGMNSAAVLGREHSCLAEKKAAGGGEEGWSRDRGTKGIGGDLRSCLPAELRSWTELLPPARGGLQGDCRA